ncbi:class I SAM-dependent methyltransferase [Luteipulveratus halotolerans]|uniref:class I SAM-dependent methyltransferase n=1 Tax=Luteipulveratus halotolerans TaxID=1631356 RepID=UPI000682F6C0|nr:class I SAM-dependent methyltransferase [Luteipulveratus halotolerans]
MPISPWTDDISHSFIAHADRFEPGRAEQIAVIAALAGPLGGGLAIDLCAGTGDLSGRLLADNPHCTVVATDVSKPMLERLHARLGAYADRLVPEHADLADRTWRRRPQAPIAVVSMLAVHLLDDAQKQELYRDLFELLAPGGRVVMADLVAPADQQGRALAARTWDAWVAEHAGADAHRRFRELQWNPFEFPGPEHQPAALTEHLRWLDEAGFGDVDVYWMLAGHAVFGGRKGAVSPSTP